MFKSFILITFEILLTKTINIMDSKKTLSKCYNCDSILIDQYQKEANRKKFLLNGCELKMKKFTIVGTNHKYYGCPNCKTNEFLINLS